jgi:pimeloyl-ACP methyl ester carboxylesterase
MLTVIFVILGCLIAMVGVLLVLSPGRPRPILDAHGRPVAGSISEKTFVEINGARQGMFMMSRDKDNPVLLYVHGGMPDYFLSERNPTGLEDHFTVCWWEQRGAGLSYHPGTPKETITVDQLISDTIAITNYLRDRFGKEKIYLMGHSGGTFIAIQAAARAPHLYHAYLGVAQVSNQLRSELLNYEYMVSEYQKNGDARMVKKLKAAPVTLKDGPPKSYLSLRDVAMHRLGIGTMRNMKSVFTGIMLPSFLCRQYTLREKINMWRAKAASGVSVVWDAMIAADLAVTVPQLDLPVYFLEAIYDYTGSYTEAKSYFEKLKAPRKGFYTFNVSAHSPFLEEPAKFNKIIQEDVLKDNNELSDSI